MDLGKFDIESLFNLLQYTEAKTFKQKVRVILQGQATAYRVGYMFGDGEWPRPSN